jgi:hypothetical protein
VRTASAIAEKPRVHRHPRAGAAASPSGVTVKIEGYLGALTTLGDAQAVLRGSKLKGADRAAVANALRAVQLLRSLGATGAAGQARLGVTLILHANDADLNGPYAEPGSMAIGSRNPIMGSGGPTLPYDVALHEMMHVAQFAVVGSSGELHPAIAEGISDSFAMLATGDWRLGEAYGTAVRDARTHAGKALEQLVPDYRIVRKGKTEAHAAGGVVVQTMHVLAARIGREAALNVLIQVVNNRAAWNKGGSWQQFAAALSSAGGALWPDDPVKQHAVAAALAATHLDEALPAAA